MNRNELFESLLSSSANNIADNQNSKAEHDENITRLNKKINSSLQ